MFGLVFIGFGLEFFAIAVRERIEHGFSVGVVFILAMSLSQVLLGIKVFRNGFPKRTEPKSLENPN